MMLIQRIKIAEENKPAFGKPCNHCGWCCLTEVCNSGKAHGAGSMIPCKFLVYTEDGRHLCGIVDKKNVAKDLKIGFGCNAATQKEMLNLYNY